MNKFKLQPLTTTQSSRTVRSRSAEMAKDKNAEKKKAKKTGKQSSHKSTMLEHIGQYHDVDVSEREDSVGACIPNEASTGLDVESETDFPLTESGFPTPHADRKMTESILPQIGSPDCVIANRHHKKNLKRLDTPVFPINSASYPTSLNHSQCCVIPPIDNPSSHNGVGSNHNHNTFDSFKCLTEISPSIQRVKDIESRSFGGSGSFLPKLDGSRRSSLVCGTNSGALNTCDETDEKQKPFSQSFNSCYISDKESSDFSNVDSSHGLNFPKCGDMNQNYGQQRKKSGHPSARRRKERKSSGHAKRKPSLAKNNA